MKKRAGPRGLCLKSQLFGHANDQCAGVDDTKEITAYGVKLILNFIYQRDGFSLERKAYRSFNNLLKFRVVHLRL